MSAPQPSYTCREVVDVLDAYLEHALPPPQQHAVDVHLAGCDACAVYLRGYDEVKRLVRDAFD
jgi:anti-sigma factor RsiW